MTSDTYSPHLLDTPGQRTAPSLLRALSYIRPVLIAILVYLSLWDNQTPWGEVSGLLIVLLLIPIVCSYGNAGKNHLVYLALPTAYLLSSRYGATYSYYENWNNTELPLLLALGLGVRSLWYLRRHFYLLLTVTIPLFGLALLLLNGDGLPLSTDDHTSFYYRLELLKENFPVIPFYNPEWNAGYDAREFLPSGVLNFFLLFLPAIYLFKLKNIYTLLVATLIFVIAPALNGIAAFMLFKDKKASWITALLTVLGTSLWYKWALSFGTLGFVTSMALLPVTLLYGVRFVSSPAQKAPAILLLTILVSLTLMWPLAGLMLVPAGILLLPTIFNALKTKSHVRWLACALLLVNLPWMILFVNNSPVARFVSKGVATSHEQEQAPQQANKLSFERLLRNSTDAGQAVNPLLVIGILAGIGLLPAGKKKQALLVTLAWLLFTGLVLAQLKPQLELKRALVAFYLLGTLVAGKGLLEALEPAKRYKLTHFILSIPALGMLCLSPLWLYRLLQNAGSERITYSRDLTYSLANSIKEHTTGGRALVAGFSLHEMEGGHLAPLPHLSGVPMLASGFYHNRWAYKDVIPDEYRAEKRKGVLEYLDLMNVETVVTHEALWRSWFNRRKRRFENVAQVASFNVFKLKDFKSNYFFEGSGKLISQDSHSITVRLDSTEAILKFKFFSFLESSACTLEASPVKGGISLIKMKKCPLNTPIVIQSKSPIARLFAASTSHDNDSF